jgi:hypothetical protein
VAANDIITTRRIPGGSVLEFYDNVIILTKDETDAFRAMNSAGWYTDKIQGGDGSGMCTFNIYNNWTTNDPYLTSGQPFATRAFNATKNAPGQFIKGGEGIYPASKEELVIHLDENLTATDLMESPNPKYHITNGAPNHLDYHTDNGIDGLYYKQTDKVKNSAIYKSGAGCQRLVNGK